MFNSNKDPDISLIWAGTILAGLLMICITTYQIILLYKAQGQ